MRDDALNILLHRVGPRHGPDGSLARTMRSLSAMSAQAREIHKERGAAVAQAVIKGEMVPKFIAHVAEIQRAITAAGEAAKMDIRSDWAGAYGLSLNYRRDLSALGCLTESDWSMAEMDAKKGAVA